jgi:acetyl esterase/lipase
LGENPDPALLHRLSIENSVTAANPPTFIWHTANDGAVPVANALRYAEALASAKVPFALHVYPDGRHGLGLARDERGSVCGWTRACEAWFRERGWR